MSPPFLLEMEGVMCEKREFEATVTITDRYSIDDKYHSQLYNVLFPKYLLGKINMYLNTKEDMNFHDFIMAALKEKLDREVDVESTEPGEDE